MTLLNAIGIILTACIIVSAMIWSIHTAYTRAEQRLRHAISTRLAEVDDGRLAAMARARAIDEEYRLLVLEEHNGE